MNSSSILPRQATKKAPLTPPPQLNVWSSGDPGPTPSTPFILVLKKKNRKRKKSRQGKRQKKKRPHAPLPLSSTSYVDRKERALSIEGCVTPTPKPSDLAASDVI